MPPIFLKRSAIRSMIFFCSAVSPDGRNRYQRASCSWDAFSTCSIVGKSGRSVITTPTESVSEVLTMTQYLERLDRAAPAKAASGGCRAITSKPPCLTLNTSANGESSDRWLGDHFHFVLDHHPTPLLFLHSVDSRVSAKSTTVHAAPNF